ncbi:Multiple antibiotic resistance protein marA [uncultured Clostridium sp.]|nr:putative uncharacterized protein [Firmicutes bacterium CAG:212]CUP63784.1 Multiple antibiotic resistance protein marA [Dorea longicatena]SCH85101.1 Multiple antibiotic resistance protein marA [uncultured Clostridium sp.]
MEKITSYCSIDGISLEHMIRYGKFDMRVKHFHDEYEIFYILEGERLFFFNNRSFVAKKGDLILVDSNLIHMTKSFSNDTSGHNRIILYVTSEKMQEIDNTYPSLKLVKFFHKHTGVFHLTPAQQDNFMKLYYYFKQECAKRQHAYKHAVELAVINYLLSLTRDLGNSHGEEPQIPTDGKYKHVYEIADYLSQNCEQQLSLEEIAQRFYLSKYYVCRLFKEVTGYSINEYINIHRVQKAQWYLTETDLSISEIAGRIGFGSMTHFEKIFKTYTTMTPLKYRKSGHIFAPSELPINP